MAIAPFDFGIYNPPTAQCIEMGCQAIYIVYPHIRMMLGYSIIYITTICKT